MNKTNNYILWIAIAIVIAGTSFLVYKKLYAGNEMPDKAQSATPASEQEKAKSL